MLFRSLRESEGLTAGERADLGQRVERELDRIHTIIQTLLDYARGEEVRLIQQDLALPVANALSLLAHHPKARALRILTVPPAVPVHVSMDESRVVQVLLNLVLNASDAMEGHGEVTIRWEQVGSREGEGWCRLTVADAGPGWAESMRGRATQPFVTTKAAGQGTGLGLAICERIAAELGGRLSLGDRDGGGAEVSLWLPLSVQSPALSSESPVSWKYSRIL